MFWEIKEQLNNHYIYIKQWNNWIKQRNQSNINGRRIEFPFLGPNVGQYVQVNIKESRQKYESKMSHSLFLGDVSEAE